MHPVEPRGSVLCGALTTLSYRRFPWSQHSSTHAPVARCRLVRRRVPRHARRGDRGGGHAAAPPGLPLQPSEELDERPQRARLPQGRLPPLLPVQPARQRVGQHVLGARDEQGPGPLGRAAGRHPVRRERGGVLRLASSSTPRTPRVSGRRATPPSSRCTPAPTPPPAVATASRPSHWRTRPTTVRRWTKYSGNPVIDINSREFRDPKVFWYEPAQEWRMVAVIANEHKVARSGARPTSSTGRGSPSSARATPSAASGSARTSSPWRSTGTRTTSSGCMIVSLNPGGHRRRLRHPVLRRRVRRHDVHARRARKLRASRRDAPAGVRERLRRMDPDRNRLRVPAGRRCVAGPADRHRIRGRAPRQQLHRLRRRPG